MELKDVLHLYLGCKVLLESEMYSENGNPDKIIERLAGIDKDGNCEGDSYVLYEGDFKLILRPLSSMTEEEALHCIGIAYESVYTHKPEFIRVEMVDSNQEAAAIICEEPGWKYGFSVTKNGIDFSANGSFLHIPQFEITAYLLSKGFDLFNLIPSNQAIESKP